MLDDVALVCSAKPPDAIDRPDEAHMSSLHTVLLLSRRDLELSLSVDWPWGAIVGCHATRIAPLRYLDDTTLLHENT